MLNTHVPKGSYKATIPVDRLENRVLSYIRRQGSLGERLDMNTIKELFSVAKQEIQINLTTHTAPMSSKEDL